MEIENIAYIESAHNMADALKKIGPESNLLHKIV